MPGAASGGGLLTRWHHDRGQSRAGATGQECNGNYLERPPNLGGAFDFCRVEGNLPCLAIYSTCRREKMTKTDCSRVHLRARAGRVRLLVSLALLFLVLSAVTSSAQRIEMIKIVYQLTGPNIPP